MLSRMRNNVYKHRNLLLKMISLSLRATVIHVFKIDSIYLFFSYNFNKLLFIIPNTLIYNVNSLFIGSEYISAIFLAKF